MKTCFKVFMSRCDELKYMLCEMQCFLSKQFMQAITQFIYSRVEEAASALYFSIVNTNG